MPVILSEARFAKRDSCSRRIPIEPLPCLSFDLAKSPRLNNPPSSPPANLRPPPAHPHQQKSPVLEKFRRLPLKRMPHKLTNPSQHKQPERIRPQPVHKNGAHKHHHRNHKRRNPQRMARPVHRILMARRILRNPLLATPVPQHAQHHTPHSPIKNGTESFRDVGIDAITRGLRKWNRQRLRGRAALQRRVKYGKLNRLQPPSLRRLLSLPLPSHP
jgi:hypothetical protein